MHPPLTYELKATLMESGNLALRTKARLIDWLLMNGIESFVEGALDVDINQNQDEPPRDYYGELGGDRSPLSIYRYSRESLEDLAAKIARDFGQKLGLEVITLKTAEWMDGWKDSFKPFATDVFWVRPPWIQEPHPPSRIEIVIEPGMAFGTGQHATTRLCLELLGELRGELTSPQSQILDVGTGTGILAIAAKKLGYREVRGTDIEDDAILAARENALLNGVELDVSLGTFPQVPPAQGEGGYHLILANILAVVLIRLMSQLQEKTLPGGHLILSGILTEEVGEVCDAAQAQGLRTQKVITRDGWAAVWLVKPSLV